MGLCSRKRRNRKSNWDSSRFVIVANGLDEKCKEKTVFIRKSALTLMLCPANTKKRESKISLGGGFSSCPCHGDRLKGPSPFPPMDFKAVLKRAAVPLVVVAILLSVPALQNWLSINLVSHPWAVIAGLAVLAGLTFYLISLGRVAVGDSLSVEVRDAALILTIVLVLLIGGWILTSGATILAAEALRPAALRIAILWAAACFMAGFLGGFLFGVPKVGPEGTAAATTRAQGYSQRPNTNLEQISDWLTKIIVGLGLVELKQVPAHLGNAARFVAESLTVEAPGAAVISFAGSLILYFSILGFLAGYLLTLLFLAGAFGRAGRQVYGATTGSGEDNFSTKIRQFWRPNDGPPDPTNTQKLTQWISQNLPAGTTITELITGNAFDKARQKAVAELAIP